LKIKIKICTLKEILTYVKEIRRKRKDGKKKMKNGGVTYQKGTPVSWR
jgi:hypothetical protein